MSNFFKRLERGFIRGAIYLYCKIVYRLEVVGTENIPKTGGIIFCGNHRWNREEQYRKWRAKARTGRAWRAKGKPEWIRRRTEGRKAG